MSNSKITKTSAQALELNSQWDINEDEINDEMPIVATVVKATEVPEVKATIKATQTTTRTKSVASTFTGNETISEQYYLLVEASEVSPLSRIDQKLMNKLEPLVEAAEDALLEKMIAAAEIEHKINIASIEEQSAEKQSALKKEAEAQSIRSAEKLAAIGVLSESDKERIRQETRALHLAEQEAELTTRTAALKLAEEAVKKSNKIKLDSLALQLSSRLPQEVQLTDRALSLMPGQAVQATATNYSGEAIEVNATTI